MDLEYLHTSGGARLVFGRHNGYHQARPPIYFVHDPQEPPPYACPNHRASETAGTADLWIGERSLNLAPCDAAKAHPVGGVGGVGDAGHDAVLEPSLRGDAVIDRLCGHNPGRTGEV